MLLCGKIIMVNNIIIKIVKENKMIINNVKHQIMKS